MTKNDILNEVKAIMTQDTNFLKPMLSKLIGEILDSEMQSERLQ